MKESEHSKAVQDTLAYFDRAHIALSPAERQSVEIADFGLGDFGSSGLSLVTYLNTALCCSKEMVLQPGQTCPEHRHPPVAALGRDGKEETFRCRMGTVYLYVEGVPCPQPACTPPAARKEYYTVWHEIKLEAGEQYTIQPDTLHWFQSGPQGAVVSEFSTKSLDEYDIFTDPGIVRTPSIEG